VVEIPLIDLFKSKYIKSKTRCRYLVHIITWAVETIDLIIDIKLVIIPGLGNFDIVPELQTFAMGAAR